VAADLTDFSGLSVRFRWRSAAMLPWLGGWWIDDVRVFAGTACLSDLIFKDGFQQP